jgi:hypothetical protein
MYGAITAYINPCNTLPILMAYHYNGVSAAPEVLSMIITNVHESNLNLSEPKQELIYWHECLGHITFKKVQFMICSGILAGFHQSSMSAPHHCLLSHDPLAQIYSLSVWKAVIMLYSRQKSSRQHPKSSYNPLRRQSPAGPTSLHQSFTLSQGKTKEKVMCSGGCIFVNHSSNFINIELASDLIITMDMPSKEFKQS